MRRRSALGLALLSLIATGCFRLSDPIYAVKPLRAPEPPSPGHSLVLVTIVDEGLFSSSIDTLYFRRADPAGEGDEFVATNAILYRVFGRRSVKSGHFLVSLPPGAYEFYRFESLTGLFRSRYVMPRQAQEDSRFIITRPAVYDLGTFHISASGRLQREYTLVSAGDAGSDDRRELARRATANTGWEQ